MSAVLMTCAAAHAEPARVVDALVDAALAEGGFDNVSVVALKP